MSLASVENLFPDGITGMSVKFGWSSSEDGLKSLWIENYTLNEDGTVTFVIYVPKKQNIKHVISDLFE